MSLIAACPCGQRFQARPDLAGKMVKCPKCGQAFQVPHATTPSQASPLDDPLAGFEMAGVPARAAGFPGQPGHASAPPQTQTLQRPGTAPRPAGPRAAAARPAAASKANSKVWLFVLLGVGGVGLLGVMGVVLVVFVLGSSVHAAREAARQAAEQARQNASQGGSGQSASPPVGSTPQPDTPATTSFGETPTAAAAPGGDSANVDLPRKQSIYRAIALIDAQTAEDPRIKIMENRGIAGGAANLRSIYEHNRRVGYQALAFQFQISPEQLEAIRLEGEAANWPTE